METISKKLPNEKRYLVVHKLKKQPKGLEWNTKPFLKRYVDNQLTLENNGGFLLGKGYLCFDCDNPKMQEIIEETIKILTYTQKSAKRELNQYIFKIDWTQESFEVSLNNQPMGDILADTKTGKGTQIVLAPSKYQITKQDIKKSPELKLKEGEIKSYEVVRDRPISKLSKEEFMKVISKFETKTEQKAIQEQKEFNDKFDIDDVDITSVLSTSGMQQEGNKYVGSNPWHDSVGGHNFYITPSKNLAYCFRSGCDCAISPAKAIGLNEGIIKNCSDSLKGEDFIKVVEIAKEKYGLKQTNTLNDKEVSSEKDKLNFWTFKDYENYKEPKNFIIKGLDFGDEIAMNYGQTGSMKSVNMLYKAICISSGRNYLGRYKTKKLPVAILSAENSVKVDKERLIAIRRGLRVRKKDTELYILPRNECQDILSMGFKECLFDFMKEKSIKVLFLDTINPLTPELDDISTKDVTKLFNEFLKPVSEMGIRVEFLHHTDKQGKRFLGSMKFKANCDCVTRIERQDLTDVFELYNEKNRGGETNTLKVKFNFITDDKKNLKKIIPELLDNTGKPELFEKKRKPTKTDKLKDELLKSLPENMEMSRKEIIALFSNGDTEYSIPSIDRALKDLVRYKKIKSTKKGVYEKC